jgi:mitogen-activated protein kinase 7
MWSVGCIFAELLLGKPLFKGRDCYFLIKVDIDQLNQILDICGTPPPETLSRLGSDKAQMYIRSLDLKHPVSFKNIFINASPAGIFYLI